MKVSVIVPTRLQSFRFPRKILANLGDVSILHRVLARVAKLQTADEVVALVDDDEVFQAVTDWGFRPILTSKDCVSGTERTVSVRDQLVGDFVINVQGDEPFIALALLEEMIFAAQKSSADVFTAIYPITSSVILLNPNRVKVVLDATDRALYFSRHPIPFMRDIPDREQWLSHHSFWGHVGVYGYRRNILSHYPSLKKGILEHVECLEQLRLLENGISIQCIRTPEASIGIDTPEDLVEAEAFLQSHPEFDIEKY